MFRAHVRVRALCTAVALVCASGTTFADQASHNASAEAFLTTVHADQLGTPLYMQAQQAFAQRFKQVGAPDSKRAVLESYQAKVNATLDGAIGWPKLKPDMVKLYTDNFSEAELNDLVKFYKSPVGQKVLKNMPAITQASLQLTQSKLDPVIPAVTKMLDDMTAEVAPAKAPDAKAPAKK